MRNTIDDTRPSWRLAVLLTLGLFSAPATHAAIPASERNALIAIHQSTNGAAWLDDTNWLGATGTECTWAGIRCDDAESTVTGLFLPANNLDGPLPSAIGDLPSLADLELYENRISGALPSQIGSLANLSRLLLFDNEIAGPLPSTIGNLSNLRDLYLDRNLVTGSLPSAIGGLSSVETFSINGNQLSGPLPATIGQLANVRYLDLSYNQIGGPLPSTIGLLTNLELLNLTNNLITGPLPPEISGMTSLRDLDLSINDLSGPLPPQVGSLQNLAGFSIHANGLSGSIPAELGQLRELEVLTLSQNQFDGPIPPELGEMSSLRELWLQSNQLTGSIPVELTNLANLERLQLEGNQLTGTIPPEIGRLSSLLVLSLGGNRLNGSIPREIGDLRSLVSLGLDGMDLTGTIPSEITQLTELVELVLFDNELTGTIPSGIGGLTNMEYLAVGGNRLTGSIPEGITNLTDLFFLDLRGNDFAGMIPSEIGRLTNLTYLALVGNSLTGAIPQGIGDLTKLETLRLDYNRLSGTIPASLGDLKNLKTLLLSHNSFEGPIPSQLFDLTGLETLGFAGNRFDGALPAELAQMTGLFFLDVSNNRFRGTIPSTLTSMTNLADGGSDFAYNALSTSSVALRDFINGKQWDGDFEATQTVAPAGVSVSGVTDRSAVITWSTIRYDFDDGGYEVTATPTSGGSPVIATTSYKIHDSILLRGLQASTQYRVTVRTTTHPHGLQQSTLRSDPSTPVAFTTGPRVVAPAMVDAVSFPTGLIQIGGVPQNETSWTLTNFGDVSTVITLGSAGDPVFTQSPASFALAAGASQVVTIQSISQPEGSYLGYSIPEGDGVVEGLAVPITLLSATAPAGTAVGRAVTTRIDVIGDRGSDGIGTATFRNTGSATLVGILVSDADWIEVPSSPVVIPPGEEMTMNFTVRRSKRPDAGLADGTLAGTIRLVYLDGSVQGLSIRDLEPSNGSSGVSTTLVTVVDTTKPPVTATGIPPLDTGEVAGFIPGVDGGSASAGDLSITNAFGSAPLGDVALYYTPLAASTTQQAALGTLAPSQSLALADVIGSVYAAGDEGTLQIRSASWNRLLVSARSTTIDEAGHLVDQLPIFRSDRGAPPGAAVPLAGARNDASLASEVLVQEVSGAAVTVEVEFFEASGNRVGGSRPADSIDAFELLSIPSSAIPAGTASVIVRNRDDSAGSIVALARVTDEASGDRWVVTSWRRFHGYGSDATARIPFVRSGGEATSRRRPVRRPGGDEISSVDVTDASLRTEVVLMNPGTEGVTAKLWYEESGGSTFDRSVEIAGAATLVIDDVVSYVRGRSGRSTGSLLVAASGGEVAVTSRLRSEDSGRSVSTAVPALASTAGLRLGQATLFAGLEDSTRATRERETPGTFRTAFGVAEIEGSAIRVSVTVLPFSGGSLAGAVIQKEYAIGPREILVVDDLLHSIIGDGRETLFGDLRNLQVEIRVIEGEGAATAFVITTENASRDALFRLD